MNSILDHVTLSVSDYERSKAFYTQALAPLGIALIREYGKAAGFGKGMKPEFWISGSVASYQTAEHRMLITPVHLCFKAADRAEVAGFHRAALAAGAKDFGAPGLRPEYHLGYYGAFVLDPDGHNIEAAIHEPSPKT